MFSIFKKLSTKIFLRKKAPISPPPIKLGGFPWVVCLTPLLKGMFKVAPVGRYRGSSPKKRMVENLWSYTTRMKAYSLYLNIFVNGHPRAFNLSFPMINAPRNTAITKAAVKNTQELRTFW